MGLCELHTLITMMCTQLPPKHKQNHHPTLYSTRQTAYTSTHSVWFNFTHFPPKHYQLVIIIIAAKRTCLVTKNYWHTFLAILPVQLGKGNGINYSCCLKQQLLQVLLR